MDAQKLERLTTLLKAMDDIIRNDVSDEEIQEEWLMNGIPDGYNFETEPKYEEDIWVVNWLRAFKSCIRQESKRNGKIWN